MTQPTLPLIIYHDNCADGFGAAWAAYKKFGADGAEYLPMNYNNPRVKLEGKKLTFQVDNLALLRDRNRLKYLDFLPHLPAFSLSIFHHPLEHIDLLFGVEPMSVGKRNITKQSVNLTLILVHLLSGR